MVLFFTACFLIFNFYLMEASNDLNVPMHSRDAMQQQQYHASASRSLSKQQKKRSSKRERTEHGDFNGGGYAQQHPMGSMDHMNSETASSEEMMGENSGMPSLTISGAGTILEFFQLAVQRWNEKRQARGECALQIRFIS